MDKIIMSEDSIARLLEVEQRTYHIDGKVAMIENQLSNQGVQLNRIEQFLINKPGPNYLGMISLGVTILLGALALTGGMAAFMNSQIAHVKDDVEFVVDKLATVEEFRHQMHFEVGLLKERGTRFQLEIDGINKRADHFDELYHINDRRLNEVEKENSAGWVRDRAMGDYIKQEHQ